MQTLLHLMRFTIIRMSRGWLALFLLVVLPLILITIFGPIAAQMTGPETPLSGMTVVAVTYILAFQLFGGAYTMSYIKEDLFAKRKWRMYALPLRIDLYSHALIIACTFFSVLQGLVLVLFTATVYGVRWGNPLWVVGVLLATALLSQLVCLVCVLSVKNFSLAERLSEVYGFGSLILAGGMFDLPDMPVFRFLSTYGNPISLGRNVIFGHLTGAQPGRLWLSLSIVLLASVLLYPVTVILGKRRLS
jgi:ABC-2 type transport system permease protein